MSRLTRGQIDQLISRYGLALYGTRGLNRERRFNATDMFNLMVAGQLHELGLTMPAIRDVLLFALGLYAWDNATDQPAETYPGELQAGPGRHVLGVFQWREQWHAQVRQAGTGDSFGPKGTVAIVIDATGLVERIRDAAAEGEAQ